MQFIRRLFIAAMLVCGADGSDAMSQEQPNIIVILADDLGYSDLGCYGGEINTPNIDALAGGGVKLTQVYNSARCCPSRAALMTGLYPTQAGIGDFTRRKPDSKRGPGYLGRLRDDCVTMAEVLKPAGYGCYYVGKWHLHNETGPIKRGFDDFYGYTFDHSHDQYDADFYIRLPAGKEKEIDPPADEFYATDVFNDYAIEFIKQGQKTDKPWFLFLGHSSPHFPVQAPAERADKYEKTYLRGWDVLREERFERMQQLGLIDGKHWKMPPREIVPVDRDDIANHFSGEQNPAWDSLEADRQRDLARRMAVFAAMVEGIDTGVGQITEHLKKTGDLENTLIVFLSDNGACYEWGPFGFDGKSRRGETLLRTGNDVREIGGRGTHQSYGSAWANLGNTPFRMYKHFTHEGGISTPFIAHWPKGIGKQEGWVRDPAHMMDVLPTLMEAAGAEYPKQFASNEIQPMEGRSLLPAMRGKQLPQREIGFDHQAAHAFRDSDWKIVYSKRTPEALKWELYNLANDRCELSDLADKHPRRLASMVSRWEQWGTRVGVTWEPYQSQTADVAPANAKPESPEIANSSLKLHAEAESAKPNGVVIAQGGQAHGYALHFIDGRPAFDVRIHGKVTRLSSPARVGGTMTLDASLTREKMTLSVNGGEPISIDSPGLIPVQPVDSLSIGFDERSPAGDYDSPNRFNGKVLKHSVDAIAVKTKTAQDGKPFQSELITQWGAKVTADNAWTEYPRPQMKREKWVNLNGMWEYSITPQNAGKAGKWDGEILVPFAIEAPLSGVGRLLEPDEAIWYRRNFSFQQKPEGRLLLHFEAVDYQSEVWVNGKEVGGHVGGNLPFSFDITEHVKAGKNTIALKVVDRTSAVDSFQLRGKQKLVNRGIFYTRVSGIWQSVWLEPVPENYIKSLKVDTKMSGEIRIAPSLVGKGKIRTEAWLDGRKVAEGSTVVKVDHPKLWSPDSPTLYQLKVFMQDESGQELDRVESYAGIREVGKAKDKDGNWRFTLNGKTIFHWGPLDQGWWPDGLLTPPSEDAMLFEINFLKQAGFNMIRKHIKVEPRLYYYHCDRLGMLVWQDQVSGGKNPNWYRLDPSRNKNHSTPEPGDPINAEWPDAAHEQWMAELKGMIDHLYNYPSIVSWVPFNEAWGQHRTMEVGEWIVKYDPSRSINIASGGNFAPVGDIADMHSYPHPEFPFHMNEYDDYIKVVGEFGGHGWKVDGHEWDPKKKNFIYGDMPKTIDEYAERYAESIRLLGELKTQGISAGVYTQTTDVEGEINGLMTYDRKVIKISAEDLATLQSENGLLGPLSAAGEIPTNTSSTVKMNPIYKEVHPAPDIAGSSLQIVVEASQKNGVADGVLLAHGGNVTGYSLHVEQGIPVFEVTQKKEIFRVVWPQAVKGRMRIVAELNTEKMSLSVNGEPAVEAPSPGLLRAQPKIGLSVGYDARSNAGSYEGPNPFNGTILSTRIDSAGKPPATAKVMDRATIESGLKSHVKALFIKEGWIRDPYIILGPDDYYYLTGTTPNPGEPREQSDPYNTGLGDESIVGWQAQVWRSTDLIDWESLGTPFTLKEGIWFEKRPKRFEDVPEKLWFLWAPEVHWLGDRWALTHTSPSPVRGANLALTEGAELKGPWTHPMGVDIGHRHDPSLFKDDDGIWYLLYGNTEVTPLSADFSKTTAEPVQIDPSGSRTTPAGDTLSVIGHEGATMRKIGDKYVHIGTAWSTDTGRKGSYNLYYCTADKITGPYGPRKFAGRFLGHGTPFQDKQGRWWCTAFYNGNIPPVGRKGIETRDLSATAQTINQRGVTIVPLDVKVLEDGEIYIRAKDPAYANPGPDEVQQFSK